MKPFYTLVNLLLLCTYSCTQSPGSGCNQLSTTNGLITGNNKNGVIPVVRATPGMFRSQVGGYGVAPWSLFSATQVRQHGLWCQVSGASNAGMGSDIGDMFYPTEDGPDGFTVVPTSDPSNNVPFQQLKCTNQTGVIVDGDITNFQGFLKCNTTIPNLDINTHYRVIYSDQVFNGYTGPTVDSSMALSILSPRDADDFEITLSFTVSFGPPSKIICRRNNTQLFLVRDPKPRATREVIRSRYINSTHPDMTRVTIRPGPQSRAGATYNCTVTVEGRINIASSTGYDFDEKGMGSTSVTLTVASPPIGVSAYRISPTAAFISWSAPSPSPAGYEVFYHHSNDSVRLSAANTTDISCILSGLTLGEAYDVYVLSYGAEGAPVLPSTLVKATVTRVPQLLSSLSLASTGIAVSWTAPFYTPADRYKIVYFCQRLCDSNVSIIETTSTDTTSQAAVAPGTSCTVNVTAMIGNHSSSAISSSINTTTEAPTSAPKGLTSSSVESRSLTVQWGTVPCPDQRGPITGYRLRYTYGTTNVIKVSDSSDRQHVLTKLTPFTNYSVQVAAINAGGTGPYSTALTVETLQGVPGPVSDLSATSGVVQLTISWTAPSEPNGVITMYQVAHNSTGVLNYTNTSATQLTVRDIPPNTAVEYSVRAYTIIGPGEAVSSSTSTKNIPQINIISAVSVNSTAVKVTWTPLDDPLVEHYTVYYTTAVDGVKSMIFPASASSGVVSGLQEGQWYQFSVTVSLRIVGQVYNSTLGQLAIVMTDKLPVSSSPALLSLSSFFSKSTFHSTPSSVPSLLPTSCPSSATFSSSYSAGLSLVSVIMLASLIGNLVSVICCVVMKRRNHFKKAPVTTITAVNSVYDKPGSQTEDGEGYVDLRYETACQVPSTDEIHYEAVNEL